MSENNSELAITYAALILQDDNCAINANNLLALTKAANLDVEPVWANIFAKALEGRNLHDLLMNVGSGGGGAPAAAAGGGGGAAGGAAEAAPAKEEKKEEEKEESDEDMGFGLFD